MKIDFSNQFIESNVESRDVMSLAEYVTNQYSLNNFKQGSIAVVGEYTKTQDQQNKNMVEVKIKVHVYNDNYEYTPYMFRIFRAKNFSCSNISMSKDTLVKVNQY